ncbi:hypothetical protein [uncultured Rikenella sp.]|uniref:hypothetical protein n=1 Tax=uncultured Rikenella sp. TaxID=368003 RepID=UPI0025CDE66B|nr:hypothetical protein [uncultured Rikenella sp.]
MRIYPHPAFSFPLPFPAPGFRDAGNYGRLGDLSYVGNSGFSWSFATSGIYGLYLNSYTAGLNPSNIYGRGYGFQLRCLSE